MPKYKRQRRKCVRQNSTPPRQVGQSVLVCDPIEHLPPELVVIIFVLSIQPESDYHPYNNLPHVDIYPRRLLLTLATVSSSWRTFVCGTPELWSTCWLSLKNTAFNSLWLSRTGSRCLLDINAYSRDAGPSSETFLSSILPYAHRIRSLIICPGLFENSDRSPNIPKGQLVLPHLDVFRSLHLVGFETRGKAMLPWMRDIVQRAQKLRVFEAWEADAENIIKHCSRTNLTHVNIYRSTNHEALFDTLTHAPKLQSVSCGITNRSGIINPVRHTHLTKLGLRLYPATYFDEVLEALTLPSLQYLSCAFVYKEAAEALCSLLERSRCTIRALYLSIHLRMPSSVADILSILENKAVHSSLEVLQLDYALLSVPHEHLRFLSVHSNLPCLRRLLFTTFCPRSLYDDSEFYPLLSALDDRTHKTSDKLQYVEIFLQFAFTGDLRERRKVWDTTNLNYKRLEALAWNTGADIAYEHLGLSLRFGRLRAFEAFKDNAIRDEVHPWVPQRISLEDTFLRRLLF